MRRILLGWLAGGALLLGGYALFTATHPALPPGTPDAEPGRAGFLSLILVLPLLLSGVRLAKEEATGSIASWLIPGLLAVMALLMALPLGFAPGDPFRCAELARREIARPVPCSTDAMARSVVLIEAAVLWGVFGAWTLAVAAVRRRSRQARDNRARRRVGAPG
ncbi:MAG: hypothetical protein M3387_05280 [Actinomycetota bacterium]|nr:hypothetical protein [Actinomycetota bacterium]